MQSYTFADWYERAVPYNDLSPAVQAEVDEYLAAYWANIDSLCAAP